MLLTVVPPACGHGIEQSTRKEISLAFLGCCREHTNLAVSDHERVADEAVYSPVWPLAKHIHAIDSPVCGLPYYSDAASRVRPLHIEVLPLQPYQTKGGEGLAERGAYASNRCQCTLGRHSKWRLKDGPTQGLVLRSPHAIRLVLSQRPFRLLPYCHRSSSGYCSQSRARPLLHLRDHHQSPALFAVTPGPSVLSDVEELA